MVHSLHVLQVTLLFSLSSYCFDLGGHEDWAWPGSTFDGLALGYGFPGWELPPLPLPLPLPPPEVHNHFHHYPHLEHDPHHHYNGHDPHHHSYGHDPHHHSYGHDPHHHSYGHDPHHHSYGHDPHHHSYGHGPHGPPQDFSHSGGGSGHGDGYGSSASSYKDHFCHHAKKMKHLRKWLVKMLSCSLYF